MNNGELTHEKERLTETLECIDSEMNDLNERLTGSMEAANEQTAEALTRLFLGRLKMLILIKDKPYFSRVDFTPAGGKTERLYIGKTTVLNNSDEAVTVDWRAPVSTLYYEGRVGEASYTCPDGEITGEITLKRQFEIENRQLLSYNDIDITFDEELLKPYLSVSSSMRLKNIIATIQSEQNRIIRAGMLQPLIVQGVAGSGKTTVALHRIAYLIYTYAASLKADEFLIIAPNALFLNYIGNVLPDLGVEDVRQSTFEAFVQEIIGKKLKIEDAGEKLSRILNGENAGLEERASRYKSSLRFRDAVGNYLKDAQKSLLPKEDLRAGRYLLCPYAKLEEMLETDGEKYALSKRVNFIKERLLQLIGDNTGRILARIDAERNRKLAALPPELTTEEFRARKQQIFDEDEKLVHDLVTGGKGIVKAYLKKIRLPSALQSYHGLISDLETLRKYADGAEDDVLSLIVSRSKGMLKGQMEYEDLAPLMTIHARIHGNDGIPSVKHVVIDEAQDLSAFQFRALKEVLECSSMSIFGDVAQGIYGYRGTNDWDTVAKDVFGGKCDFAVLQKSYRSTVEIMEQANRVITRIPDFKEISKAEPVIRNGQPVRYLHRETADEVAADIAQRVHELRKDGMRNIAVICKTMRDCTAFAEKLRAHIPDFHLITGKEYAGGLIVVPSYLVKGLEFDAVAIADAAQYGESHTDIKLLYVAMTRAMHCMDIYYTGDCPSLVGA